MGSTSGESHILRDVREERLKAVAFDSHFGAGVVASF